MAKAKKGKQQQRRTRITGMKGKPPKRVMSDDTRAKAIESLNKPPFVMKATQKELDELVGNVPTPPPPAAKPPARAALQQGIYLNAHRNVAIVVRVGRTLVHYITMCDGAVKVNSCGHPVFLHEYALALPAYPLRRAARIFLNSHFTKTDGAERELRAILVR